MLETIGRWMERHPRLSRLAASALCRRDVPLNSAWQTIGWWETRRIPYNLVVGSAGIFSSAVIVTIGLVGYFLFHSEFPAPTGLTIIAVIMYALIANLCYTGGWLAEIIVRKAWPGEADRFAVLSFSLGLAFSVLLTLLPGFLAGVGGIFALLAHLPHLHR
ncbi:MAG TPA: hypothetical protein VNZ63_00625 [Verrucomicrobiae bacterium]|jgi:hypothetical protein|nr:hypothetical protein [Verrucomicrobiae bacterium]